MLEKILQEIEQYESKMEESGVSALCPGWVKEIIKKHLSANDLNVHTNDGKISIDDERLWQILFDEACVEGQQADRIYKQLKEICGDGWIPVEDGMPEERNSMFAKYKGTNRWSAAMFEKISDDVNVTVEYEDGTRRTITTHTVDGKWVFPTRIVQKKVIAWRPLPSYYKDDITNKQERSSSE